MSELIFGPSIEWLPNIKLKGEVIQPRLDGGYNLEPVKKIGGFICKNAQKDFRNHNQPNLFEDITEEKLEN